MDELIAKLEQATGPDREIDLHLALLHFPKTSEQYWLDDELGCLEFGSMRRYTASLDAAVKLVEEKLPDWTAWELKTRGAKTLFQAELSRLEGEGDEILVVGYAKTPALALCSALLKALLTPPE